MKKTGFKTFVCSFVFSLFIVLIINGLFFYAPKTASSELRIPTKNIALFFLDAPQTAGSVQVKPIKKIALSLPKSQSLEAPLSALSDLSPPSVKVAQSDSKDLNSPSKSASNDAFSVPLEHERKSLKKPSDPPKMLEKDKIKNSSESSRNQKLVSAKGDYKDIPLKGVTSITDSDNDTGGDYDTGNDDYSLEKARKKPRELLIASNETKPKPLKGVTAITDPNINKDQGRWDTGNDNYETEKAHQKPKELLMASNEAKPEPLKGVTAITDPNINKDQGGWDTGNDDYETEKSHQESKELLMASNETKPKPLKGVTSITDSDNDTGGDYDTGNDDYSLENSSPSLLIPLQKDFAENNSNDKIKIVKNADDNQIAMVSGNTPISSMINEKEDIGSGMIRREPAKEEQKSEEKGWETMAEKSGEESPWVAAKGGKYPKNNSVLSEDYYKNADNKKIDAAMNGTTTVQNKDDEVKLASDMVKNILIPIPEDILNDDNLTPQLESSNKVHRVEDAVTEREMREKGIAIQEIKQELVKEEVASMSEKIKDDSKSSSLLKSITSIFSSTPSSSGDKTANTESGSNSFVDRIAMRINRPTKGEQPSKILPAEMRLSFQPNRAEISGITLKWLQAFANKVNQDNSVILEVRIDGTSSYALQQKRLNLLHNILTNKGVDYSKINTVFTSREPNSFIIRTVRINSNNDRDVKEKKDQAAYYQSW